MDTTTHLKPEPKAPYEPRKAPVNCDNNRPRPPYEPRRVGVTWDKP